MKPAYGQNDSFGIEGSSGVRREFTGDAGPALRAAREASGLSVAAVAKATRIRPDYLQALEDGDCRHMPAKPYTLAYAKTYADHVGLDPVLVVEAMKAEYLFTEARQLQLVKARARERRMPRGALGAAAVVTISVMAMTWYGLRAPAPEVEAGRPAPTPEALLEWSYRTEPDRSVWNAMAEEVGGARPMWRAGAPLRAESLRPENPGIFAH